jgi:hypothetical protein
MPSFSPDFFRQAKNMTECEDCFQTWADEFDYEMVRAPMKTERLAVAYPFGVSVCAS